VPALRHGRAPSLPFSRCSRGYPIGQQSTSNPDLDLVRVNLSSPIDEDYGSFRLDYRLNDKHAFYLRYFRDQGYLQSPLDVSQSYSLVTAVPQNAVLIISGWRGPT